MIFTGRMITADEAYAEGLVNRVIPPDQLIPSSLETAKWIVQNSPIAVLESKLAINMGTQMALYEAMELEKQACTVSFATDDRREGMEAFIQKRKPQFRFPSSS